MFFASRTIKVFTKIAQRALALFVIMDMCWEYVKVLSMLIPKSETRDEMDMNKIDWIYQDEIKSNDFISSEYKITY